MYLSFKPLLNIVRSSQLLFSGETMLNMSTYYLKIQLFGQMGTHIEHFLQEGSNIWNQFLGEEVKTKHTMILTGSRS